MTDVLLRSLDDGVLTLTMNRPDRLNAMNQELNGSLAEVMDAEALRHHLCFATEDHKEAAAAFIEKRAPLFKGR